MNKRGVFASLIGVFLAMLGIPTVLAQEKFVDIGNTLYNIFGWVFVDLSKHVGEQIYFFWVKFLLWVLLLSFYFFGAGFVFKEQKRIATVVAVVLAFMSVLFIPNELLLSMMKIYTVFAAIAVMSIPVIAIFMINYHVLKEDNPANHGVKAILYLFVAFVFSNIAGFEQWLDFKYFTTWAGFAESLCVIAFIYNLIMMIMGVSGGAAGAATTWPGGRTPTPATPGTPEYPDNLVGVINQIHAYFTQFQDICTQYLTAINHVLARNHHNVNTAIAAYYIAGAAHPNCNCTIGTLHPIGWGRTQARNYTCIQASPYGPTPTPVSIPPDNAAAPHGLVHWVGAATNLLVQFNHLSGQIRHECNSLFTHANFLRLSDHDRQRAADTFTQFSQLEADTLLIRVMAHNNYQRGEAPPPHP